jgi:hypothetical protein
MGYRILGGAVGDTTVRTWLTTGEVGERYRVPPETIRYWRHISYGPRGVKIGRHVLYALDEVERWEQAERATQGGGDAA